MIKLLKGKGAYSYHPAIQQLTHLTIEPSNNLQPNSIKLSNSVTFAAICTTLQ